MKRGDLFYIAKPMRYDIRSGPLSQMYELGVCRIRDAIRPATGELPLCEAGLDAGKRCKRLIYMNCNATGRVF